MNQIFSDEIDDIFVSKCLKVLVCNLVIKYRSLDTKWWPVQILPMTTGRR